MLPSKATVVNGCAPTLASPSQVHCSILTPRSSAKGHQRQIGDVRDESGSPPIAPDRSNNGLGHDLPSGHRFSARDEDGQG
jgi:hypothetical protein